MGTLIVEHRFHCRLRAHAITPVTICFDEIAAAALHLSPQGSGGAGCESARIAQAHGKFALSGQEPELATASSNKMTLPFVLAASSSASPLRRKLANSPSGL